MIKRHTVAKEACDGGRVTLGGRPAKAGTEVKPGDALEIRFGSRLGRYEVLDVQQTVRKELAGEMYRVLNEDEGVGRERE